MSGSRPLSISKLVGLASENLDSGGMGWLKYFDAAENCSGKYVTVHICLIPDIGWPHCEGCPKMSSYYIVRLGYSLLNE